MYANEAYGNNFSDSIRNLQYFINEASQPRPGFKINPETGWAETNVSRRTKFIELVHKYGAGVIVETENYRETPVRDIGSLRFFYKRGFLYKRALVFAVNGIYYIDHRNRSLPWLKLDDDWVDIDIRVHQPNFLEAAKTIAETYTIMTSKKAIVFKEF